jgi:hypothetical protein
LDDRPTTSEQIASGLDFCWPKHKASASGEFTPHVLVSVGRVGADFVDQLQELLHLRVCQNFTCFKVVDAVDVLQVPRVGDAHQTRQVARVLLRETDVVHVVRQEVDEVETDADVALHVHVLDCRVRFIYELKDFF